jgi:precorrin-2 dehydrogenase/sirohydrochlorin ferrochelatase
MKARGAFKHTSRRYRKGDLRGAALLIAATGSADENRRAAADAGKDNVLINVVDTPELCNFIVPSVVRRGPLQIAVSTSGASPALAREIRKELESFYGPEFGRYLKKCATDRTNTMASIKDPAKRRSALKAAGSADALKRIRRKR